MKIHTILWVVVQYYFCVAQMVPALATESSFAWLLCPSNIPPHFGGGQRREGAFLTFWH